MPARPRWLLAIPDAIRQLDALDRELLTRRDIERLFGVSKVRAAQLMATFGAGRTGHILTLPRAELLRQLRRHRKRAAFRGEEARRDRVVTEIRKARLTGIRVAVPVEALEARLPGLPAGVSVEPGRIEVRFSGAKDAVGRLFALAQALTNDYERFEELVEQGRPGRRRGSGAGMNDDVVRVELTDIARTELAQRAELVLPRLIVDAGPVAGGEVSGVLRRADRQPAHARGVRAGRGAVPGVVRGAGPGAHGGLAAARGGLHPDPPRVGAHRQAAPGGHPHARRLARRQPGPAGEPGGGRPGAEARGDDGRDAGALAGRGAPAPRGDRHGHARGSARPGARLGDVLQLRAGERGHRHAAAGLLPAGAPGVAQAPREGRHAARRLTGRTLSRRLVLAMIKRRAAAADLPPSTCCHTFRATGITAYLSNGGTLEHAQQIAGHASPKTTKLYDRTADTITVDEIERIVI